MSLFTALNRKISRSKFYPTYDSSKNKMTVRMGSVIMDSKDRFKTITSFDGCILGFVTESKASKCLADIQSKYNLPAVDYVTDPSLMDSIYKQFNT